jgi:hypothetical protein
MRISQVKVRLRISSERVSSTISQLSHGQEGNNNGKSRSKTRPRRSTRNRSLHHSKRKQQPESTSSRKPGYRQHLQMCRRVARTQARMAGRVGNKATQSQASMAMTVLQDISTVREGMSPLTISILRPIPSNLCESGLKRFH